MITIFKNGKPIRHVECPDYMYEIQCQEGETYVEGRVEIPEDTSFKESLSYKLMMINREYEEAVNNLTEDISKDEKDTWVKQESEARAWVVDNNSPTPLLSAMCEARGCSLEYMVGKVIEKSDLYTAEVGRLLGEKQRKEKELLGEYK